MLSNAEILGISKVIKDKAVKEAREGFKAGDVAHVDVIVRVKGTLSIGKDSEKTSPQTIFSKAFIATCLNKLNDSTAEFLMNEMAALLELTKAEKAEALDYDKIELKPQVRKGFDELVAKTLSTVKGSASFTGTVTPVEVNTQKDELVEA